MGGVFLVKGETTLRGEVHISGAKNAALPIMAASILCDDEVVVENVPKLLDVIVMKDILVSIGFDVSFEDNRMRIKRTLPKLNTEVPYELVRKMRASFNVLGPLAVKMGQAKVALPGGCSIGVRPVDFHIEGLRKLGFEIEVEHGFVRATRVERVDSVKIVLPFPSVGATEHLMTTAVLMEGTFTVIENAAMEPEIEDLQNFLNAMGGKVRGAGTSRIEIEGVRNLSGGTHRIIPDRIEAGTYLIAIAATCGRGTVRGVKPDHLTALLETMRRTGATLEVGEDFVEVSMDDRPSPVDVVVNPYPGFPTDLQPQMMAYLCVGKGVSTIIENVFKTRFMHVGELRRMGANIEVSGNTAIVKGVEKLSGAPVLGTDLRATAALVIAGLMAKGQTEIHEVHHIFRGYENVLEKFAKLGANIEYVPTSEEVESDP